MARDITVTGSGYRFECPLCGTTVRAAASQQQIDLLVGHKATSCPRPVSPALTMDDVISFHQLLQDDRNIEAFLSIA